MTDTPAPDTPEPPDAADSVSTEAAGVGPTGLVVEQLMLNPVPVITGSVGGGATGDVVRQILTALHDSGIITDSTT